MSQIRKSEQVFYIRLSVMAARDLLFMAGYSLKQLPSVMENNGVIKRGMTVNIGRSIGSMVINVTTKCEVIVTPDLVASPAHEPIVQIPVIVPSHYELSDKAVRDKLLCILKDGSSGRNTFAGEIKSGIGEIKAGLMRVTHNRFVLLPKLIHISIIYPLAAIGLMGAASAFIANVPGAIASVTIPVEQSLYSPPYPSLAQAAPAPAAAPPVAELNALDAPVSTPEMVRPPAEIEVVMGDARGIPNRKLYVFSDPLCPFCKKTEPMLVSMAAKGYEIHIFPTPIHDGSFQLIRGVACAKDKAAAWNEAITNERMVGSEDCDLAGDANAHALAFFRQFGFNSTPTMINEAGESNPGAMKTEADLIAFTEKKAK